MDNGAVKYIDYELDVKVFPDGAWKILDKDEYAQAKLSMDYPEDIDKILWAQLDELIKTIKSKSGPFNQEFIDKWYKKNG
jgi:protein associated with RNAse G/E